MSIRSKRTYNLKCKDLEDIKDLAEKSDKRTTGYKNLIKIIEAIEADIEHYKRKKDLR